MLNIKDNSQYIRNKITELRLELYKEYQIYGYSERVIKKSQELDKYIFLEQQELLKK